MKFLAFLFLFFAYTATFAADLIPFEVSPEIQEKIIAQGVPRSSLNRIIDWMSGKRGSSSSQRVYKCAGQDENDLRPCDMEDRAYFFKTVSIGPHRYAASINFTLPSTEKRFFFIDLQTGNVQRQYVSHGKGSGKGAVAEKFSNTLDSNMSSLGTYLVGENYVGGNYPLTLRLYGLDATNDAAYDRDIVFHSADYADESFFQKIDPSTGEKYNRLGLSNGCPAISPTAMNQYFTLMKDGGIIDAHHDNFTP